VLTNRTEVITLLLENGANPNFEDNRSETAFSWACAVNPAVAHLMLSRGFIPKGDRALKSAICSGNLDLVRALCSTGELDSKLLDLSTSFGQVEITEYLSNLVKPDTKSPSQLLDEARKKRSALDQYHAQASRPLEAPKRSGGISNKRGAFPYIVESWSPWMETKALKKLTDCPAVGIYVPKDYDGKKPFGLLVSMTNAKSSSPYPRAEYAQTLDRHHVIWAGFDPYKWTDPDGSASTLSQKTNVAFCLAIVYNMLGYFNIERSRIYVGGFSFGGQLTDLIAYEQPWIFKGFLFIGIGAFFTEIDDPSSFYCRQDATVVFAAGDYDYNRLKADYGYNDLISKGDRNTYFVQDPMMPHRLISGACFEKAVSLLDKGKN
jgi:hypothetical protein